MRKQLLTVEEDDEEGEVKEEEVVGVRCTGGNRLCHNMYACHSTCVWACVHAHIHNFLLAL